MYQSREESAAFCSRGLVFPYLSPSVVRAAGGTRVRSISAPQKLHRSAWIHLHFTG